MAIGERDWAFVTEADRAELLREGVVVVQDDVDRKRRRVDVTAYVEEWALEAVGRRYGPDVEISYLGQMPRVIKPLRCVAYMEREPGRLQVRFVIGMEQHVDEIVFAEDDGAVVIYGTVCTPANWDVGERYEGPWHIYLDRPLGDREVIDGVTGKVVPYRNVWAEIEEEYGSAHSDAEVG
jgi:hypothetical protein